MFLRDLHQAMSAKLRASGGVQQQSDRVTEDTRASVSNWLMSQQPQQDSSNNNNNRVSSGEYENVLRRLSGAKVSEGVVKGTQANRVLKAGEVDRRSGSDSKMPLTKSEVANTASSASTSSPHTLWNRS